MNATINSKEKNANIGVFECKKCDKYFEYMSMLQRHIKVCNKFSTWNHMKYNIFGLLFCIEMGKTKSLVLVSAMALETWCMAWVDTADCWDTPDLGSGSLRTPPVMAIVERLGPGTSPKLKTWFTHPAKLLDNFQGT